MIEVGIIAMAIVMIPVVILCLGVIGMFFYKTWQIGKDIQRR